MVLCRIRTQQTKNARLRNTIEQTLNYTKIELLHTENYPGNESRKRFVRLRLVHAVTAVFSTRTT